MLHRLRRQRRRLALCLGIGAAAGILAAGSGVPLAPPVAAAVGGGAAAGLAAGLVALAPGRRRLAPKLAAVALVAALAAWLGAPPGAVALAAGAGLLLPAEPGFLDALPLPFITRARVQRRLGMAAPRLWAALCPRATRTHWDSHVRAVRQGSSPDIFVYEYRPLGRERGAERAVRVFDVEPGYHFKLRDLALPDARAGGPVTVTSFVIEPDGGGARLTLLEASWRQGLWTACALWLDDYLADHADRMAALLEGRPDRSLRGAGLGAAQARGRTNPTRS